MPFYVETKSSFSWRVRLTCCQQAFLHSNSPLVHLCSHHRFSSCVYCEDLSDVDIQWCVLCKARTMHQPCWELVWCPNHSIAQLHVVPRTIPLSSGRRDLQTQGPCQTSTCANRASRLITYEATGTLRSVDVGSCIYHFHNNYHLNKLNHIASYYHAASCHGYS